MAKENWQNETHRYIVKKHRTAQNSNGLLIDNRYRVITARIEDLNMNLPMYTNG